jgi:DnaJ-class molecular chaperone
MQECPRCWGSGGTVYAPATWNDPEDSEACGKCEGTGMVHRKVNVYRKKKITRLAA